MGIATLRMPMLPAELPPDRREMILMAGRASYLMATRNTAAAAKAFEALALALSRNAERPLRLSAYSCCGRQADTRDRGVQARARAAAGASLVADADRLRVPQAGRRAAALPWAKQAVAAAPNAFPARKALGQALLETGDVDGAIRELLAGIKLAPESPGLHFQLARAYQRAGRLEDANARARGVHAARSPGAHAASGAQSVGGTSNGSDAAMNALNGPRLVAVALHRRGRPRAAGAANSRRRSARPAR